MDLINPPIGSLSVHVRKMTSDSLRISWYDQHNGDSEYVISADQLRAIAAFVRECLDLFIQAFIRDSKSAETSTAMVKLIAAGHDLFESLFLATEHTTSAQSAREHYFAASRSPGFCLYIKVDPLLAYPWPLAVPSMPAMDDDIIRIASGLFWCLRHDLSISAFGAGISVPQSLKPDEHRAFAALHKRVFDAAVASLESDEEKELLRFFEALCGGQFSFEFNELIQRLRATADEAKAKLRLAYMLGHASGDRFQLSEKDEITASILAARLGDTTHHLHRQQTFLFLNGCDTAGEGKYFPFTNLLKYPNISGIIGSEVRVPDRFAFRFALAFFYLIYIEGKRFREALSILRRCHFPISLAYTLYAPDIMSISPITATKVNIDSSDNYSEGRVKCTQ